MKVLKFGGTSVGTVESLRNVKKIVEAIPGKAVIVVSALGGLTDKLIATTFKSSQGDSEWHEDMNAIRARHHEIIQQMIPEEKLDEVTEKIESLLGSLEAAYEKAEKDGVTEQLSDEIVSFGERMSSEIVAAMVEGGKRYYSPDFVKTEKWYGKNIAAGQMTEKLIQETFSRLEENEKAIVPGFISTDRESGVITNLGRGGSDFTGALIAAALDAEVLEIWTDVDGFMTADPRVVKDALIINHLTFTESMELCTFGAKVIYPPTIYPVFHKNIPIKILNTFNPSAPGTVVTDHPHRDDFDVKGVTAHKGISLVTIKTFNPGNEKELHLRGLNALSRQGVNIFPLSPNEEEGRIFFGLNASDSSKSKDILSEEFIREAERGEVTSPQLEEGLSALAIVGKEMNNRPRLKARICHSLEREGINVKAFSDDSDTTLVLLIDEGRVGEALRLIHSLVF
ncbi:MAG: aspartate kinase [Muribaculaceae bacterium]|nr:aspartate kinase [Muribaculaceae bacterium]